MKTHTELLNKIIKFTSAVENCEIDFDRGMKTRVISISESGDDVLKLLVDFSEFEEENKKFAQANYYDAAGNPTLFWWETKMYPENKRETLYLEIDPKKWPFEVMEEKEKEKKEFSLEDLESAWWNSAVSQSFKDRVESFEYFQGFARVLGLKKD